ncbi:MAG: methyltransferase domain-containing protein [Candidatus Omnitrophota bacterium]
MIVSKYEIKAPSLDLGCGNGIISFITAGGNFSIDYDWYINVDTEGFWENKDIYDVCKTASLNEYITERPKYNFTFGLDHKRNLLKQARALNFYESLIEHDAKLRLPFKTGSIRTVFSNIIYWLPDLKHSLREINRILMKGGSALLCVPNSKFFEYCYTYQWKKNKSELLRLLNRGRGESMRWTVSYNEFASLVKSLGFKINDHLYYLSPSILKIWDIGFRPFSSPLIKMANSLNQQDRRNIKKEWMETAKKFLPLLLEMERKSKREGGFHFFYIVKER